MLKAIKSIIPIIITLLITSCGASFGEKYTLGNLEIYFEADKVPERYVEAMGEYFKTNDLILDHKHSVQLTADQESYIMKMVLSDDYEAFPESEKKNLELLEADIRKTVFNNLQFKIQICNGNFVPINPAD